METVETVNLLCLRIRKVRFFVSAPLPCRLRVGHQILALAVFVRIESRQPHSGVVELVKRLSLEQEVDGSSPSSRATGISEVVSRHLWEMEAVSSILTSQTTSVGEMEITEVYETSIIGSSPIPKTSRYGESGKHATLKMWCRKACWFKSSYRHQLGMGELVDPRDLKSLARNGVQVRVLLPRPYMLPVVYVVKRQFVALQKRVQISAGRPNGRIAQWSRHLFLRQKILGSNPSAITKEKNMITLILLTILVLIAEVFLFCCAVILCLLPIIGLCKLIEWIIDRQMLL